MRQKFLFILFACLFVLISAARRKGTKKAKQASGLLEENRLKAHDEIALGLPELDTPYTITLAQQREFIDNGHLFLPNFIPEMKEYAPYIREAKEFGDKILYKNTMDSANCKYSEKDMETLSGALKALRRCVDRMGVTIPFYQNINQRRYSAVVAKYGLGARMAEVASILLREETIIMYEDSTFFKAGTEEDGFNQQTGDHQDLNQIPADTDSSLTLWCPLERTTYESSVMTFYTGSHRDTSYKHWYTAPPAESQIGKILVDRYPQARYDVYEQGDCSVHHGWLYHRATRNLSPKRREAIGLMYLGGTARKLHTSKERQSKDVPKEDYEAWKDWYHELGTHELIRHRTLPVVYSPSIRRARTRKYASGSISGNENDAERILIDTLSDLDGIFKEDL